MRQAGKGENVGSEGRKGKDRHRNIRKDEGRGVGCGFWSLDLSSHAEASTIACLHPSLHHVQMPVPFWNCSGLLVWCRLLREQWDVGMQSRTRGESLTSWCCFRGGFPFCRRTLHGKRCGPTLGWGGFFPALLGSCPASPGICSLPPAASGP